MKTFTINMQVKVKPAMSYHADNSNCIDGVVYDIYGFDMNGTQDGDAVVTITMKDGFDPVPKFVADLEEQKRKVTAEFAEKLSIINEQIHKFTALEMA